MKRYHAMNVFGVILIIMLALVNLGHVLWTWWLISGEYMLRDLLISP